MENITNMMRRYCWQVIVGVVVLLLMVAQLCGVTVGSLLRVFFQPLMGHATSTPVSAPVKMDWAGIIHTVMSSTVPLWILATGGLLLVMFAVWRWRRQRFVDRCLNVIGRGRAIVSLIMGILRQPVVATSMLGLVVLMYARLYDIGKGLMILWSRIVAGLTIGVPIVWALSLGIVFVAVGMLLVRSLVRQGRGKASQARKKRSFRVGSLSWGTIDRHMGMLLLLVAGSVLVLGMSGWQPPPWQDVMNVVIGIWQWSARNGTYGGVFVGVAVGVAGMSIGWRRIGHSIVGYVKGFARTNLFKVVGIVVVGWFFASGVNGSTLWHAALQIWRMAMVPMPLNQGIIILIVGVAIGMAFKMGCKVAPTNKLAAVPIKSK